MARMTVHGTASGLYCFKSGGWKALITETDGEYTRKYECKGDGIPPFADGDQVTLEGEPQVKFALWKCREAGTDMPVADEPLGEEIPFHHVTVSEWRRDGHSRF